MIICLCEGVSSREIEVAARNGARSVKEVSQICRAGKGCGACHEQILAIIRAQKTLEDKKPCAISRLGEI